MSDNRYQSRGVSAGKEDVHKAIRKVDKGLFPKAFCKIVPDHLTGDSEYCCVMHADGAGTKSSLAYMYWKKTGDASVWKGIAQDALIMNIDDLLCVGATGPILLSSTIGRNKNLITGEVLSEIINGTEELLEELRGAGIKPAEALQLIWHRDSGVRSCGADVFLEKVREEGYLSIFHPVIPLSKPILVFIPRY